MSGNGIRSDAKGKSKGRTGTGFWKEKDFLRHILPLWLGCTGAVMALGLWHLTDVRAGVLESGDRWLYGWYGGLMGFALLVFAGLGYLFLVQKEWELERAFAAAVMGMGLMYMVVLPPLSAPDEISHFISAYQLSSHMLGKQARAEDERVYIRAQDAFIEDVKGDLTYERVSAGWDREADAADMGTGAAAESTTGDTADTGANPDMGAGDAADPAAVVLGQDLNEGTYRTIRERGLRGGGPEGTVMSYQMPVRTTPMVYVPQALGIALGRLLGLGGLGLLFLGRLCNLMFFTVMGWLTIRKMPFGKEVAAGAALLPMTLHLAASFSYDVMIISLSGYFAAVCLHLAYKAERVKVRDVAVLALVMAVMGPCKMVYGVIAGFCLLIPVKKFGGWGKWTLSAASVLGAFAAAMVLVNHRTVALYTQADQDYVAWAQETGYTFGRLVHSPMLVLKMCYNTLMWQGEQLYSGMIGGALGHMDAVLNTPYAVILGLTAILAVLALRKPGETIFIRWKGRLWIWFLCLVCLGALMFSMLLAWTPVTSQVINGVQGRYLLPVLPIFLLSLKNDKVVRTDWDDRGLLFGMAAMDIYVVLRIFSLVCLRI